MSSVFKFVTNNFGKCSITGTVLFNASETYGLFSNINSYVNTDRKLRYDVDYPSHKDDGVVIRVLRTCITKPEH